MIYIAVIGVIYFAERFIKNYIEKNKTFGEEEKIMKGKITIQKYHNQGAALNFMEKKPNLILGITATFIGILLVMFGVMLPKRGNILNKLGLSLLLGGALSNFSDRLIKGYVTDYFSFNQFGRLKKVVFNLADMFIFLGAIMVTLASFFKKS